MCCHAADILFEDEAYRSGSEIRPFEETLELHAERVIAKKTNFPTASLFFRTEYAKTLPDWYFSCPVGDIPLHLYMASRGTVCYMDEKMSMYRQGREGSWGAEMDSADAHRKWERHFIEMRAMYMSFDADTGLRYHDSVNLALDRSRFLIDLKEGNMKVILKPENRRFLEELPKMERQLLMLRARLPFVYDLIRRSYLLLKGRT